MVSVLNEKGYAPATVRDTYGGLVSFVFSTAVADDLVATSPCIRISLPQRSSEDEVVPAPPEAVRAIAREIDPRYSVVVLFLAATGA